MEWLSTFTTEYPVYRILISIGVVLGFRILRKLSTRSIFRRAIDQSFDETRSIYIRRTLRASIMLAMLVVLGIIWEVTFEGLSVYLASFLTVVGVGLFATWSIVSNITAAVILFFFFPLKVGSKIKIVDGDNSAIGTVIGLSLFSIHIKQEDGTEIYYPNNLAIQKGIIHFKE